ncbi:MAG: MBL fold metallo-hydrolase [Myxococcota bacterium]
MSGETERGGAAPVMLGLQMPNTDRWSDCVFTALGQNPSAFTGPGTNTYLVGTGEEKILLDTGDGRLEYLPILEQALEESGCRAIQEIVLTHGHPDHIGGVQTVLDRFGSCRVSKMQNQTFDAPYDFEITDIADGDVVETQGATLRALHTPGHAPDHLCFLLEEERALFTGDNVLGVGTTIIPAESGSLADYMESLDCLLAQSPENIFPAHGPLIQDGCAKIREYIDHRLDREQQILSALQQGVHAVTEMVETIYAGYPKLLYPAAGQSVTSHLIKLQAEGRVQRSEGDEWSLVPD